MSGRINVWIVIAVFVGALCYLEWKQNQLYLKGFRLVQSELRHAGADDPAMQQYFQEMEWLVPKGGFLKGSVLFLLLLIVVDSRAAPRK